MLVLSRKPGESLQVGPATITVVRVGRSVRLAITAPPDVVVVRDDARRALTANDNSHPDQGGTP